MVAVSATGGLPGPAKKGSKLKTSPDHERPEVDRAFVIHGAHRPRRWLVTCDHASNAVPAWVAGGDLGLPPADMARHIAWDVGAAGLSVALADCLGSAAILSTFSRLVIDPNRGAQDPTLIMRLYDGTIIPANRHLTPEDAAQRMERLYTPYHTALAGLCAPDTVIVAIHSFTPRLQGRPPRPWHVGVLHSHRDDRLSRALLASLSDAPDLCIGDNQPYAGHLPGDSIDRHALSEGRHNTLIELRHDLIGSALDQEAWANRLACHLRHALAAVGGFDKQAAQA